MNVWNLTGSQVPQSPPGAGASTDGASALSVTQAANLAVGALDSIPQITVVGEVTGFRGPNARSGHCYFSIKDDESVLDCIIWKRQYDARTFDLRDGMKINITGRFNLFKPQGRLSFRATSFSLAGEGMLRQQVAELAERLRREGLMEPARKRKIPVFCTRVAVVTSLSGAVIDDVKRTLRRRNPLVELICVGSKVQGEGAPEELISGLRRAAAIDPAPDCILLVRGGGSFEDLMTFNDESLARAVAASPVPVVTGIGHEPDTSICDMVSDRRCSTPTAAAESVAPAIGELAETLASREQRLFSTWASALSSRQAELASDADRIERAMSAALSRLRISLEAAASRPVLAGPENLLDRRRSDLEQTADRFSSACLRSQDRFKRDLEALPGRLAACGDLSGRDHALTLLSSRLGHLGKTMLAPAAAALASGAASLEALSPLKVLARGYAIAYDGEGHVASAPSAFSPGDPLRVKMATGEVRAEVTEVIEAAE